MQESDDVEDTKRSPQQMIVEYLLVLLFCTAGITVLSFFARQHHVLELMTHFKPLYFVSALFTTVALMVLRRWRWVALSGVVLLIHAPGILGFYLPRDSGFPDSTSANLSILSLNILSSNDNAELVLDYIESSDSDIVLIQEVSQKWIGLLAPLVDSTYSYTLMLPQDDNFGIGVMSRIPLVSMKPVYAFNGAPISVECRLELNGREVSILNFHPLPPGSASGTEYRDRRLEIVGRYPGEQADLSVIGGDFNVTPWAPAYKDLMEVSGLYNTREGFGVLPTFPTYSAVKPLFPMIPIDHILVSESIHTVSLERGPDIGSDHRPLLVRLHVPASAGDAVSAN